MALAHRWMKCNISEGMLPMEYAVVCNSSDGREFSFFASEDYIDLENSLVKVFLMDRADDNCLVHVPFEPLEGTSRTIKVSTHNIVDL